MDKDPKTIAKSTKRTAMLACVTASAVLAGACTGPPAEELAVANPAAAAARAADEGSTGGAEPAQPVTVQLVAGDPNRASVDLDPAATDGDAKTDLALELSRGSMTVLFLVPENGARAAVAGMEAPDRARCQALRSAMVDTSIPDLENQNCLCVETDQGRLAAVRIDSVTYEGLTLEFLPLD